jgi:hypothetical protein
MRRSVAHSVSLQSTQQVLAMARDLLGSALDSAKAATWHGQTRWYLPPKEKPPGNKQQHSDYREADPNALKECENQAHWIARSIRYSSRNGSHQRDDEHKAKDSQLDDDATHRDTEFEHQVFPVVAQGVIFKRLDVRL